LRVRNGTSPGISRTRRPNSCTANVFSPFPQSSLNSASGNGGNYGSGIFIQGNETITFSPTSGQTTTISDVIIHIRYTAREAGDPLAARATTELLQLLSPGPAGSVDQLLLFCLRYDFPTQWSAFVNGSDFQVTIDKSYFPYAAQDMTITITAVTLYAGSGGGIVSEAAAADPSALTLSLKTTGQAAIAQPADAAIMIQNEPAQQVFLVLRYRVHI